MFRRGGPTGVGRAAPSHLNEDTLAAWREEIETICWPRGLGPAQRRKEPCNVLLQ